MAGDLKTKQLECKHGKFTVFSDDIFVGRSLAEYGEYSEEECAVFNKVLGPDDIAIEVGSNIGAHTVPMARLCKFVYAFEPQQENFQLLTKNLEDNSIQNVIAAETAVGSRCDLVSVPTLAELKHHNYGDVVIGIKNGSRNVAMTTLDLYVKQKVKLIKIDCQGMELDVLKGAAGIIARDRPVIYLENDQKDKSEALIGHLIDLDYRCFWHKPALFYPGNHNGNPRNVWGKNIVSINMLCVSGESRYGIERLDEVYDPRVVSSSHFDGSVSASTVTTASIADGKPDQPSSSTESTPATPAVPDKRAYPAPAQIPTQEGSNGICFDFNDGCRVLLPESAHPWRVRLTDADTGNILFETELKAGRINSTKRYFVRFRIEVWQNGKSVFVHDYSVKNRNVLVQFPVGTLGDPMGWFPYAVRFQEKHGCRLTCLMGENLIPLFRESYPNINFVTAEEIKVERFYATYSLGLFFDDKDFVYQPCDFRHVGLHRTAGYILGVDPTEIAPRITLDDNTRPIAEPYVCIAVQSTTQSKYWNNPNGWREIVAFIKAAGYRVVCIDLKPSHGAGLIWNHIPNGAEDETGERPLQERARWLKHAAFFVGLSSGLSWLAWAVGTPVVMISGFTHPSNEFETPYRVINYHTCNSCWNDVRHRFDHKDFMYCPRHKDTPRQFECTRLITSDQVKATISKIAGFGTHTIAQL